MGKKGIALLIVAILVIASVGVAWIAVSENEKKTVSDLNGCYFDVTDAETVSICTVETGTHSDSGSKIVSGGAANISFGNSISTCDGVSYKGYQNKLFKTTDGSEKKEVRVYGNESDLHRGKHSMELTQNIVYLEKCGSLYLMVFYTGSDLDSVYNLILRNADYWNNGLNYSTLLVDADTGKSFEIDGVWCGSSYWRYQGTNEVLSSMQYMGTYNGEEYFKVNVECNKYCSKYDADAPYSKTEGIIAFKVVNGELIANEIMVDKNALTRTLTEGGDYHDSGSGWTDIDGKVKPFGYEMELYDNGVIRYQINTKKNLSDYLYVNDTYLRFVDGTSKKVDMWYECDGYVCSDVTYVNDYFPTACVRYASDGSSENISYSTAESYRIASQDHITDCIYRSINQDSTDIYILNKDWTVDRITLYPDLTYTEEENIFKTAMNGVTSHEYSINSDDYQVYNNEIFHSSIDWAYSTYAFRTGLLIIDDWVYSVGDKEITGFRLTDGTSKVYSLSAADSVSAVRVDGDGNLYAEGSQSDRICKLVLGEDGFQLSSTAPQLMTLKTVLADSGN